MTPNAYYDFPSDDWLGFAFVWHRLSEIRQQQDRKVAIPQNFRWSEEDLSKHGHQNSYIYNIWLENIPFFKQ